MLAFCFDMTDSYKLHIHAPLCFVFYSSRKQCGSKYIVVKWTTHSGCHPIQVNVSLEVFTKVHVSLCEVYKAKKRKTGFAAIMRPDNIVK